jgi:hypothetical protein
LCFKLIFFDGSACQEKSREQNEFGVAIAERPSLLDVLLSAPAMPASPYQTEIHITAIPEKILDWQKAADD